MANVLINRMMRAARLDVQLYEEVEADDSVTGQAVSVVVMSAFAAGIGSGEGGFVGVLFVAVAALVGWYVWAYLTYWIFSGPSVSPARQGSFAYWG
jgi:hypothetical protein